MVAVMPVTASGVIGMVLWHSILGAPAAERHVVDDLGRGHQPAADLPAADRGQRVLGRLVRRRRSAPADRPAPDPPAPTVDSPPRAM